MIDTKFTDDMETSAYLSRLALFIPVIITGLILNRVRGIRIHLLPVVSASVIYALSILVIVMEESLYYYYVIMTFVSAFLVFFFGKNEYYNNFLHQNQIYKDVGYQVCYLPHDKGANKVDVYYPANITEDIKYKDVKWASDGMNQLKGLTEFSFGFIPQFMFKHLLEIELGVNLNSPLVDGEFFTPIIFSHGMGQMSSFFSTLFKDLAM